MTNPKVDLSVDGLIIKHHYLVSLIAGQIYRRAPHATELAELTSLGNLGLVMAANRWEAYCEEKGYSPERLEYFVTFAGRRIRGAIIDDIRKTDYATRTQRSKNKQLIAAGFLDGATEGDLSEKTGMTVKEIRKNLTALSRRPASLDNEDIDIEDNKPVESQLFEIEILRKASGFFEALPEIAKVVLALHYYSGIELQAISVRLDMPDAQVSKIHTETILALFDFVKDEMGG